jgi:RecA-family ATPase
MVSPSPTEEIVGGIVAPGGLGKSMMALETCRSTEVGENLFRLRSTLLA